MADRGRRIKGRARARAGVSRRASPIRSDKLHLLHQPGSEHSITFKSRIHARSAARARARARARPLTLHPETHSSFRLHHSSSSSFVEEAQQRPIVRNRGRNVEMIDACIAKTPLQLLPA